MRMRRFRWLDLIAAALAIWIGIALWRSLPSHEPRGRVEVLRAAFERASAECYREYRGVELQACLAGVMEAHLHALGGDDEQPEASQLEPARVDGRL